MITKIPFCIMGQEPRITDQAVFISDKPEIKETHPEGCTLNQIIKCHGDQPINELLKHIQFDEEK